MDDERQVRLECVRLASHPDKQINQILDDAQKLLQFIMEGRANGSRS